MSLYVSPGNALTYLQSMIEQKTSLYQNAMEQLASGNKYSSVADDPVSVCESAKLAVEISSNSQAASNVKVGKDMLIMAEDFQGNIISNLQRIRDLAMQAANGTYTPANIDAMLNEIRARLTYIDNTATSTNFDKVKILDGSAANLFLQIGTNSSAKMSVGDALINVHTAALGVNLNPAFTGANWTKADIHDYMGHLDAAISTLLGTQAKIGGYLNRLDFVSSTLGSMGENLTQNKSVISDTDVAATSADLVKYQIQQDASVSILTQANQVPTWALKLLDALN